MIRDLLSDPGRALLAALLSLCILLIIPILAAFRRKARERERQRERRMRRPIRRAPEPREPRFGPAAAYLDDDDDDDVDDDDDDSSLRAGFGAGPRRGKPMPVATLSKVAWFGLGAAVGAGVMALSGGMLGISDAFRMPIGPGLQEAAESAPPAVTAQDDATAKADVPPAPQGEENAVRIAEEALAGLPAEPPPPAAPPPPVGEQPLDAQLAEFVAGMKAQLPMPIGREINLVSVDAAGKVVTLAFSIRLAIPESDYPALQKTLEQRFRQGICNGKDELRIRALNQAGITFSVRYSDLVGKTVARMEVLPGFCKASG